MLDIDIKRKILKAIYKSFIPESDYRLFIMKTKHRVNVHNSRKQNDLIFDGNSYLSPAAILNINSGLKIMGMNFNFIDLSRTGINFREKVFSFGLRIN